MQNKPLVDSDSLFTLYVSEKNNIPSLRNYPECLSKNQNLSDNHTLVLYIILNPPKSPCHPHSPSLHTTMKHPHDSPKMHRGVGSDSSSVTTVLKPCILMSCVHKELTRNYTTQGLPGLLKGGTVLLICCWIPVLKRLAF